MFIIVPLQLLCRTLFSDQPLPGQTSVKRKTYITFADFVSDCAQIFHNAKLYNRHDSAIYRDAQTLEEVLKTGLKAICEQGFIASSDATLPYLGPLPTPSPTASQIEESPDPEEDSIADDEEEEDEEDEEEDEENEESDGKKRRSSRRTASRLMFRALKSERIKAKEVSPETGEGLKMKDDPRRKRGRPPRVDTPMEMRIKNVLKSLRKFKDER